MPFEGQQMQSHAQQPMPMDPGQQAYLLKQQARPPLMGGLQAPVRIYSHDQITFGRPEDAHITVGQQQAYM